MLGLEDDVGAKKKHQMDPYDNYIVCSWGGVRSKMIMAWLREMAPHSNVFHVHDRFPPPSLTYVEGERFSKRRMTKNDAQKTMVIFVFREPWKAISSRISKQHCLHIQGTNCNTLGGDRNLNLLQYVRNTRDDLHIREHWKAYAEDHHDYPILFVNSTQFFNPVVFQRVRDHLRLPVETLPPRFLQTGDRYHRNASLPQLHHLQRQYTNLTRLIMRTVTEGVLLRVTPRK